MDIYLLLWVVDKVFLGFRLARDLRSKMSRIQLPIVKSFRVSLCEQPQKKICWDPKGGWKSVFEVSQPVQAG